TLTFTPTGNGVFQTAGKITGSSLLCLGSGTFSMDQPTNNFTTFAANVSGTTIFTDANALTVGTVGGTSGINAPNNSVILCTIRGDITILDLLNAGTQAGVGVVRLVSGGAITEASVLGRISASALGARAAGAITLTTPTNDVGTFAAL